MLSLLPRWLKPGRISIVCLAVMLVTTGCAGGSASHASQTRTGSRRVLATFGEFFIATPGARFFGHNHPLSALALYQVSSPTLLKSERM